MTADGFKKNFDHFFGKKSKYKGINYKVSRESREKKTKCV